MSRYTAYFLNYKLHRTDGPAIEWDDGYKEWWINDKRYSEQEFNDYIHSLKIPEYFKKFLN